MAPGSPLFPLNMSLSSLHSSEVTSSIQATGEIKYVSEQSVNVVNIVWIGVHKPHNLCMKTTLIFCPYTFRISNLIYILFYFMLVQAENLNMCVYWNIVGWGLGASHFLYQYSCKTMSITPNISYLILLLCQFKQTKSINLWVLKYCGLRTGCLTFPLWIQIITLSISLKISYIISLFFLFHVSLSRKI